MGILSIFNTSKVVLESQLSGTQIAKVKKCNEELKDNFAIGNFNEFFYHKGCLDENATSDKVAQ